MIETLLTTCVKYYQRDQWGQACWSQDLCDQVKPEMELYFKLLESNPNVSALREVSTSSRGLVMEPSWWKGQ